MANANIRADGVISVAGGTNTIRLADAIYNYIQKDKVLPTLNSLGQSSITQTIKALARARSRLLSEGVDICWYSYWNTVLGDLDQKKLSIIVTKVEFRNAGK